MSLEQAKRRDALRPPRVPVKRFGPEMPAVSTATPPAPIVADSPQISFVMVVYKMADQAMRTVQSMLPPYQLGVTTDDYEIIVVENESDAMMDADAVHALAPNVTYVARAEPEPSPIGAANAGAAISTAPMIGMVIDGARMFTPGLVSNVLAARRFGPNTVVSIPGYHLGFKKQQEAAAEGYDEAAEAALLDSVNWPEDGYRLFEIGTLSGTSARGAFLPMQECNCLCVPRAIWDEIGGYDTAFKSRGGGLVNLDLFKRTIEHPDVVHVNLLGEGTFHQFHGGVTTGGTVNSERQTVVDDAIDEYIALRGERQRPPTKRAIFLGAVPETAQPHIAYSSLFTLRNTPQPNHDGMVHSALVNPNQPLAIPATTGKSKPMIYMSPAMARYVPRKMVMSTWVDHIPFAYDIIEAVRPEVLVELGSHQGMSFFAFCQSMQENNVDGSCYAIDTWAGDEHTGAYGDEIHDAVRDHLRAEYWGFTYMLRMYFNEAAGQFTDESIDLCHIDGLHTYEAVNEDMDTWYPKMKPGGIILFHDVQARLEGYGTWKFWEETVAKYDDTFTFNHGFGLGVMRKPGGDRTNDSELVQALFSGDEQTKADLRELYVNLSRYILLRRKEKFPPKNAK